MAQTAEGAMKIAAQRAGLALDDYLARRAAGLKRCTGCKEWHPVTTFNVDKCRSDGLCAKGRCCSRVKVRRTTKGQPSVFKGRTHSATTRAVMSASAKARGSNRTGKKHTLEVRAKISRITRERALRGPDAPGYIDGKGAERRSLRLTEEYKRWRYDVFSRDGWMCVHCGDDSGGNLEAHHRKEWAEYPELRFVLSNGITLCRHCHWLAHTYHGCIPGLN